MIYYIVLPFLSAALASAWWIFYFKKQMSLNQELLKTENKKLKAQHDTDKLVIDSQNRMTEFWQKTAVEQQEKVDDCYKKLDECTEVLLKERQRSFDLQQGLVAANERFAIYQSTIEKGNKDEKCAKM